MLKTNRDIPPEMLPILFPEIPNYLPEEMMTEGARSVLCMMTGVCGPSEKERQEIERQAVENFKKQEE